jgi:hypothetical protein
MMKKITLSLVAVLLTAFNIGAQINNPVGADGYYIVKWDCANDTWATANNFEIDETITFAVDVTGTPLEDWLRETPIEAGATRSIAINKWTGFGDFNGDSNRLKQIRGNIYGATYNFAQFPGTLDLSLATVMGEITYFYGSVFGFEYTDSNPGANWYLSPIEGLHAGESEGFFKTLPYTGTKTGGLFYNDEYPGLFDAYFGSLSGYAPACAPIVTGIDAVAVDSPVIGHEYYNLQGVKLSKQPEDGLFIDKAKKVNGTFVAKKVLKTLK